MKDIAEIAGVSTATVSHVINETRFVSEEVRGRVLSAMDQVGYYPNLLARSLRNHASMTIGLIIPDVSNFYYTGVAESVEKELRWRGYHMILSNSYDRVENEVEIIKLYNSLQIDGVVMVPAVGDQSYLNAYVKGRYPIVFADRRPHGYTGDTVTLENVQSTYSAISVLLSKGHRRVCLAVGDRDMSTTQDRIDGYRQALEHMGLPFDESLILSGNFSYEYGRTVALTIMERRDITAVLFANEAMTIGAMSCFKQYGYRIPEDIAVISCNDFRWTEITAPALTVVSQPAPELGQLAAGLLLERIESPRTATYTPRQLTVPTKIIIRESC